MTVLLACMAAAAMTAAQPHVFVLETELDIWDVAVKDVTGNGYKEIFAVVSDEDSSPVDKHIAVFMPLQEGGYPETPSFILPLDPRIGTLFWAEVTGGGPKELVAAHSEGATIYGFNGEDFEVVAEPEFMSLFPEGAKRPRFLSEVAHDLTGDGVDEWLVPMPAGFAIRNAEGLITTIRCEVDSGTRGNGDTGLGVRYDFPAAVPFDLDGDGGHKAFLLADDDYAEFAYGEDWASRERFEIPVDLDDRWDVDVQVRDVNDNGWPDLIVRQTQGSVNLEVVTSVYLASGPMQFPSEPTAVFTIEGAFATPVVVDVDGDGNDDIVHLKVPYSIGSFVNYFLRNRVTVRADVYLYNDGGYSASPDYTGSFTIEAPDGRRQVVYTMGDFNGSGRTDVAFGSGGEELVIHTGEPGDFLSRRPWLTLDVPAHGRAGSEDLTGNGKDDMIIYHPDSDLSKRIHVILFS